MAGLVSSGWGGAIEALGEFFRLLLGTVIYRPYVYAFLVCFLVFAFAHLGRRATLVYTIFAYLIAYTAEYSSTRNGFPFGFYSYLDEARVRELWLSNVPFWDSLSFVFLSYFSWVLAAAALSRTSLRPLAFHSSLTSLRTPLLSGVLMMLLDVVIDPVALQGEKWFLGKIYLYPDGGTYFGVTLANFAGWWVVGAAIPAGFTLLMRGFPSLQPVRPAPAKLHLLGCLGVYAGVLGFNLALTAYIGDFRLLLASLVVSALTLGWLAHRLYGGRARSVVFSGREASV